MDKCRVCLTNMRPKRLYSLFSKESKLNYSDMLSAIANVHILEDDCLPNKICLACSNRVKDAYELKQLAESSDLTLRGKSKRINFSNINDIKIEIDIVKFEKEPQEMKASFDLDFNDKENLFYNDTVIKKVASSTVTDSKKPLTVVEFLQNFQEDDDDDTFDDIQVYGSDTNSNDFDDLPIGELFKRNKEKIKATKERKRYNEKKKKRKDCYDESDDDYIPVKTKKKNDPSRHTKEPQIKRIGRYSGQKPEQIKVLIKPVLMPDIKVFPTFRHKKKKDKKTKVNTLCPFCGLLSPSTTHILTHTGEKKFKCKQCPKTFFSQGGVRNHQLTHGERKFKCNLCTAKFFDRGGLRSHQRMHSNELKHVCEICTKAFKRLATLRRHTRAHNSANKNFKCEQCSMSFFTRGNLRHHERVHTGERPFNCELCSQPYSYKHDFNRHCIKKHGVFLKRRSVYVMNAEVLAREKLLMQDLALKATGIIQDGDKLNPFDGPQASMAFTQVITAIKNKQIPVDLPAPEVDQIFHYTV